jgi:GrpB-like predicted nucleotidyltransferase (UPF0157 family)
MMNPVGRPEEYDDAPVEIVPPDSECGRRFEEERAALRRALSPWLADPIEHIGSTAVPGLAAKPVIDIMAAVDRSTHRGRPSQLSRRSATVTHRIRSIASTGSASPRSASGPTICIWFRREVRCGSRRSRFVMRFDRSRKSLLSKRRWAAEFRHDLEAYTQAKGPFVIEVVRRVLGGRSSTVAES